MSSDAATSQTRPEAEINGNVAADRRDPSPARGAAPRRSRSRSPYSPRPVRRPRTPDSRSPPPVAAAARSRSRSPAPVRRRDDSRDRAVGGGRGLPSSDICYQWKESGTCRFGNSCKFLHDAKYAKPDSYYKLSNAPNGAGRDRDRDRPPPPSYRDRYDDRGAGGYRGRGGGDRYRDDDRYGDRNGGGGGYGDRQRPRVVYRQPLDEHGNPVKRVGGEGQPCWSWEKYGECRYGDICKFDHLVGGGRDVVPKDRAYDAPREAPRRGYSRERDRYDDRR